MYVCIPVGREELAAGPNPFLPESPRQWKAFVEDNVWVDGPIVWDVKSWSGDELEVRKKRKLVRYLR